MPVYTLYPQLADGTARTFRACELPSNEAALAMAEKLLTEHETAESVAIWQEDVFVGIVRTKGTDQRDRIAGSTWAPA